MTSFNSIALNGSTLSVNGTDYNLALSQMADGTDSSLSSFKGVAAVDNGDGTISLTVGENSVVCEKAPPVTHLRVAKQTLATVYDPDTQTTYNNEFCIGIRVEIPAKESVSVKFDGVTERFTNAKTGTATRSFWFGTHFGVSDSTTATSGDLYILGNHTGFGVGAYYRNANADAYSYCGCINALNDISYTVNHVMVRAFSNCSSLTNITIPNTVTRIEDVAFSDCSSLVSISIPDSVTVIGSNAFNGCPDELFDIAGGVKYIDEWAVQLTDSEIDILIRPGTTKFANRLFYGNTEIETVVIPDSVTSVGDSMFRNCTGLRSISIGNGLTSIGYEMFYGCTGLTSITIPDNVTSIGISAFQGCIGLTSITVSDNITTINTSAFNGCPIASPIYLTNVQTIGMNTFGNFSPTAPIHIYPSLSSTNKIFNAVQQSDPKSATLYFHLTDKDIPQFTVANILPKGSQKQAVTYNIYTDNTTLKDASLALADQYTTVNVYKLDGGSW